MAWRPTGVKPLPEPMLAHLTGAYMLHRGRWVNILSLILILILKSLTPGDAYIIIGSGTGLPLVHFQAIIWTNTYLYV